MRIPFVDLAAQHKEIERQIHQAIKQVIKRSDFILGKDVALFEKEFAQFCNTHYAVGVSSGTAALFLALSSLGIGKGNEVIIPAFTYIATALAVSYTQAKPVFVDIEENTYNINPAKIKKAITKNTRVIIPVHLYGQAANMSEILKIAKVYNLRVIEDAAQAHGAEYKLKIKNEKLKIKKVGSLGDIGCFSFYPSKNLGALGDGGIITTDNKEIYKKLLMLRDYGRISRYKHLIIGYNSRLDTLQAAILRIKLRHLDRWNTLRRRNAKIYTKTLQNLDGITVPYELDCGRHVYHIYAIRVKNRDMVVKKLTKKGIGVLVHYPLPLHLQKAYKDLGYKRGDFPIAEKVAQEIISLPMYPQLKERQIRFVTHTLRDILR